MFAFLLMPQVGYVCLPLDVSGRLCLSPQVGYVCCVPLDASGRFLFYFILFYLFIFVVVVVVVFLFKSFVLF